MGKTNAYKKKKPWTSYPSPSEGRESENHSHRKLTNLIIWTTALSNSMKLWSMPCRPLNMDGSWWRDLTKCGPWEKGMANHFSILALRTPWTAWKGKKIGHWRRNFLAAQQATGDQWRNNYRKNEEMEPKQKQHPVVNVTGDESKSNAIKKITA